MVEAGGEFVDLTNGELLRLWARLMGELRARDLVRTANNPVADLGERLFCEALKWTRGHQQSKNIDATTPDGLGIQIKARRGTRGKDPTRSGMIREEENWDAIALLMFDSDLWPKRAVIVPRVVAKEHMKWSNRQQAHYLSLTKRFWSDPRLEDRTAELVAYAETVFGSRARLEATKEEGSSG